jgi:hypothetical protein
MFSKDLIWFYLPIGLLVLLILFGLSLLVVIIHKENIQNQEYKSPVFKYSNCYPVNQTNPGIRINLQQGIKYETDANIQNP